MKTLPAGMQSDLDSGATTHCTCWKVTRVDGTIMGFTDHDTDLTISALTYYAKTGFNPSAIRNTMGMSVDDLETIGAISSDAITEADISNKKYDNAFVQVYRVDWTDTNKLVEMFTGFMGSVTRGKVAFKAEVRGLSQVLNQPNGQVYQKTCNVDLFSTKCTIAATGSYIRTGCTVSAVISRRLFATTTAGILSFASDWFTAGKLTWTSGNNNGSSIEVKAHVKDSNGSRAVFDMWEAMANDIQVGDTFTVTAGCDKTIETCNSKFGNVYNFRGFPRMPGQDAIVTYASKKDVNDGSSWYD